MCAAHPSRSSSRGQQESGRRRPWARLRGRPLPRWVPPSILAARRKELTPTVMLVLTLTRRRLPYVAGREVTLAGQKRGYRGGLLPCGRARADAPRRTRFYFILCSLISARAPDPSRPAAGGGRGADPPRPLSVHDLRRAQPPVQSPEPEPGGGAGPEWLSFGSPLGLRLQLAGLPGSREAPCGHICLLRGVPSISESPCRRLAPRATHR